MEIGLNPVGCAKGIGLASVVDISERLALEWAFGALRRVPYGLLIVNDQGDIVMVNKGIGSVFGYAAAALVNQPFADVVTWSGIDTGTGA